MSKQGQRNLDLVNRKLADIWPPRPVDDSAASGGGWFWVDADGGDPGDIKSQCSTTYTVQNLLPDGSGGDDTILGSGVPLTGNGLRGARGKMNPGHKGAGFVSNGQVILLLVDETSAAQRFIPIIINTQSGGSDGDDATFASWRYDFADPDGTLLGSAAPVQKPRLSFGSVTPAADGSMGVGIDYGNGSFGIWDVGEVYETSSCAGTGGDGG